VLRGPGEVCRKDKECISGTSCQTSATGRKVCTCAAGTKPCGRSCIPAEGCCGDGDCHACGCMRCDPAPHTCVDGCNEAAGEACNNGVCVTVCPSQITCLYIPAPCEGNGCECAEQGKECVDCCCVGMDCTCGGGACSGTLYRCCCTETECSCGSEHRNCCNLDGVCAHGGSCCEYPDGLTSCIPFPVFGVRR
jgi:hypothetical protein